jgi:hypothetical protein
MAEKRYEQLSIRERSPGAYGAVDIELRKPPRRRLQHLRQQPARPPQP